MSTFDIGPNLEQAKDMADHNGLDVDKIEALLQDIEKILQRSLSEKYKAIFYLSATGLFSAEDLAEIFNHNPKNLNGDFNKNFGDYLKPDLG
ncbi:hypothetical protein [Crocosphaera chwakensis]|uniref:Uncharacterized protein n=1 Tax=Crocosphaera chwakensis CCY0110 TaxID=391612 RepID=A3ITD4_9CHRO|nr:hypothetical protein CY0110_04388 [Crocosphaera chwakensis CCY0110]